MPESRRPFGDTLVLINGLSTQERTLEYGGVSEDSVRMMQVGRSATGDHYRGIIAKYRSDSAITGRLDDDDLADLALEDGVKIVEVTHFVYFSHSKVLAVEYNQSGPREGTIRWYINSLLPKIEADPPKYGSMPIFHPEVLSRLASVSEVKLLELELPKERLIDIRERSTFFGALNAASTIGNTGRVGLVLKGGRSKGDRTPLMTGRQLVDDIRAGELDLSVFGTVKARVALEHGTETLNLLENRVASVISIPGALTTASESEWFNKIVSNYQENSQLLLSAAEDEA